MSNNKLTAFINSINEKDWNNALEISNTLIYADLHSAEKPLLCIGLLIANYQIASGKISSSTIDACINKPNNGLHDGCLSTIKTHYANLDVERICIESVLVVVNELENEGKVEEAYQKLKKNSFYRFTAFFPRSQEESLLYEKDLLLMHKLNLSNVLYAARAMKLSGFDWSNDVINILQSIEYKHFEDNMLQFCNHDIRKDYVVFNNDIHFQHNFDCYYIQSLFYPELKGLKKWVFKKNLVIDANLLANDVTIEVRGDTKVSGSLVQVDSRSGASMLFKGNLEVGKYANVGGYTQECSGPVSFTCNGELKVPLLQIYAKKVKLNGGVAPSTLIVILSKKDEIEGLPCHMYDEINERFRTKGYTGIPNVINEEAVLTALQQSEDVFTT